MAIRNLSRVLSAVSMAAVLVSAGSAFAADLPTHKAAPAAPVMAGPNWAGFYAGVEGGLGVASNNWKTTSSVIGVDPTGTSADLDPFGGRFGIYAGYNVMASSNVVAGVEGDIAVDAFRKASQSGIPGAQVNVPAPDLDSISAGGASYDASLRARLGFLASPSTLVYATGGVAFADPKYTANCAGAGGFNSYCFTTASSSVSPTQVGWTLGVGLETFIAQNWVARVEYRYTGFPSHTSTLLGVPDGGLDAITVRTSYNTNMINVGIAYKF